MGKDSEGVGNVHSIKVMELLEYPQIPYEDGTLLMSERCWTQVPGRVLLKKKMHV